MSVPNPATTDWVPIWGTVPGEDFSTKVDKDSVVAAATRLVQSKLVGTDAQQAFQINGDGKLSWGAGGSVAPDTNLYRVNATWLATDSAFWVKQNRAGAAALITDQLAADGAALAVKRASDSGFGFQIDPTGTLKWGQGNNNYDVTLGRTQAGYLTMPSGGMLFTDPGSGAGFIFARQGVETNWRFMVSNNGNLNWGPGGASGFDTSLYRDSPGRLRVNALQVTGNLGTDVDIYLTTSGGRVIWGGGDAILSRGQAGFLTVSGAGNTGFYFADSAVNLYRVSGTTRLKMDRNLNFTNYTVAGSLYGPVLPTITGPTGPDVGDAQTGLMCFDPSANKFFVRCADGVFRGVTLT